MRNILQRYNYALCCSTVSHRNQIWATAKQERCKCGLVHVQEEVERLDVKWYVTLQKLVQCLIRLLKLDQVERYLCILTHWTCQCKVWTKAHVGLEQFHIFCLCLIQQHQQYIEKKGWWHPTKVTSHYMYPSQPLNCESSAKVKCNFSLSNRGTNVNHGA